ncbi:hypothetical protein GY45DRAFT_699306 [Cubamyces sp. BRFM 1775]|nr:hypothetical protein GY45DRAFT_699306 [Cubamyces sp. BRFM 1775]
MLHAPQGGAKWNPPPLLKRRETLTRYASTRIVNLGTSAPARVQLVFCCNSAVGKSGGGWHCTQVRARRTHGASSAAPSLDAFRKEAAAPQESGCLLPHPAGAGASVLGRTSFSRRVRLGRLSPGSYLVRKLSSLQKDAENAKPPPLGDSRWSTTRAAVSQSGRLADAPRPATCHLCNYVQTWTRAWRGRPLLRNTKQGPPRPRAGQRRTNPWSPRELRRSCFVSARTWPTYRLRACPGLCTLLAYSATQCSSPFSPESEGGAEGRTRQRSG